MTQRTTITLDEEAATFLKEHGGDNKSALITGLLREEHRRTLVKAVAEANLEEAGDAACQDELAGWDATLVDGLPDDARAA